MGTPSETHIISPEKPRHPWLRQLRVSFVPGPTAPLMDEVFENLEKYFKDFGHVVEARPSDATDIIFTTASFGDPMPWREALIFNTRKRFGLTRTPTLVTVLQVSRENFNHALARFKTPLQKEHPDPSDTQIKDYLSGNLCRCAAYPEIVNAVKLAARNNKTGQPG